MDQVDRRTRRDKKHLGGTRQFGFDGEDNRLVPNEAEQQAIATMRRLRKCGVSLMAIRDAVRAKGFAISHETVRSILARPRQEEGVA